ncbi:hypothetical protein [Mesorhizobium silamurunense]|uniref:hypothetical protein n=1 Tax=Mesorhizobium silamurunense TaxID=499528 RepID=UPI00177C2681|nr:hypothetical protein [Mesorhizobium silamurunense]
MLKGPEGSTAKDAEADFLRHYRQVGIRAVIAATRANSPKVQDVSQARSDWSEAKSAIADRLTVSERD